MKKLKDRTKRLVAFLHTHPIIVADIFEFGASGMLVPEIVKNVNEYWATEFKEEEIKLTEYYIWSMFHRRRPFHDACLYSQVSTENKEKVSSRLYSTQPRFSLDDDMGFLDDDEPCPVRPTKGEAIADCVEAYELYQKRLDDAELIGLNRDAVAKMIREVVG